VCARARLKRERVFEGCGEGDESDEGGDGDGVVEAIAMEDR
jgi:hypothetical protein